ncbi:MAG: zeta toxin family protein [Victivallales bacterium]|jgi:predicted ABC-type ATPase|nr:zeta toxin family protein [Victivallales bacterium]
MKYKTQPQCYVVAGPNGAGKTTFALKYLPRIAFCHDFINADEIAKGLSPLDFDAGLLKGSKIFLETLKQKIAQRNDFAFETTLSGRSYLPLIQKWRESGWKVILIYLYIPNAEFSKARVQQRVLQGGHNIPLADILRRYPRSIRNLFEYANVCDRTLCLDNTGNKIISIFEKRYGQPLKVHNIELFYQLQGMIKNER